MKNAVSRLAAVLLGAVLVLFMFPRRDREQQLLAEYHAQDEARLEQRTLAHA